MPEDPKVQRALELLKQEDHSEAVAAEAAELEKDWPRFMESARAQADELVRARKRRRLRLFLLAVAALALAGIEAALLLGPKAPAMEKTGNELPPRESLLDKKPPK